MGFYGMLKSIKALLYTKFYISLNVLRSTVFNIYKLPFLCSPSIRKIRVKVRQKNNYFFCYFFAVISLLQYAANKKSNKTMYLLFKYFLNNLLFTVFMQNMLSNLVELLQQKKCMIHC